MIEFSARLQASAGLSAGRDPGIKRRLIEAGMDVIDLGAGDNDTPPPAAAVAGHAGGPRATRRTASTASSRACRHSGSAASRWVRAAVRHAASIRSPRPCRSSDRRKGSRTCRCAVVNPGDVAIVPEPGYQAYLGGSLLAGAEPYIVPLRPENGFLLELDRIPEAVLKRAKIVFVNYPNNPTAAVATPEYLERTVASAAGTASSSPTTTPTATSPSTGIARRASSRSPGARRSRAGVLLALEELLDDRMATGLCGRDAPSSSRRSPG